nr:hypothetical protein [uncultured Blautia sp.]
MINSYISEKDILLYGRTGFFNCFFLEKMSFFVGSKNRVDINILHTFGEIYLYVGKTDRIRRENRYNLSDYGK